MPTERCIQSSKYKQTLKMEYLEFYVILWTTVEHNSGVEISGSESRFTHSFFSVNSSKKIILKA